MAEKSKLDAALDELVAGKSTEEIVGQGGVLKQLSRGEQSSGLREARQRRLG